MAEYISREAAINAFENGEADVCESWDDFAIHGFSIRNIEKTLESLPAVSVPQWISVKDRLPEPGEHVLIWYEYFRYGSYNRMYKTYEIAYQYDGFWSGVNPLGQKARVFAWMPLPEPPKGENDG